MTFNLFEGILLIILIISLVIKIPIITFNRGVIILLLISIIAGDFLQLEGSGWELLIKILCLLFGWIFINFTSNREISSTEILILCVVLASSLMVSTSNFLGLYLCLELQSLSVFILIGRKRNSLTAVEASLKYFVLSSISSGLFLLGSALVFTKTGSCDFIPLSTGGFVLEKTLISVALLFKLAASPFHFWVPDVYQGSDNRSLLIIGILPKISVIGVFVFIFPNNKLLLFATLLSLVVGCIGAINQSHLKRLLGYSSILGIGFVLLGFSLNTFKGYESGLIYLVLYLTTFCAIILMFWSFNKQNVLIIELCNILINNKTIGLIFVLCILSMAGIPPLGGFFAKWLVLSASINEDLILICVLSILCAMIAGVYYLRLVKTIYFEQSRSFLIWQRILSPKHKTYYSIDITLGVTSYLLLIILLFPQIITEITHFSIISLF
nr:NADH dehydrogenase subunit 2 [Acromitus sp. 2 MKL-2023]